MPPIVAREIPEPRFGFWRRSFAMVIKEFIQLRRDRVSFAMIVMIPVMQLMLFGYAINTTPRNLPTAVLLQEDSDLVALDPESAGEHRLFPLHPRSPRRRRVRQSAAVGQGAVRRRNSRAASSARCGAAIIRRCWSRPTPPIRWPRARRCRRSAVVVQTALAHDLFAGDPPSLPFEIRAHARYNPAASSRLNIVPGLVGTILTMTMLIFTALSVTREIERGTMESLLSMPIRPVEVMFGKIVPYVLVGFIQASLIIGIGVLLFGVPVRGSLIMLALLSTLFITTNLSIGYTFSTIVQNQLQAMQLSMMFFLPSILLSGFMFPFAGMPVWAQYIGEGLPLTHYLRIVRAIMLKGATLHESGIRHDRAVCPDAAGHDDRGDALPPHARLRQDGALSFRGASKASELRCAIAHRRISRSGSALDHPGMTEAARAAATQGEGAATVSANFDHALAREVLRTAADPDQGADRNRVASCRAMDCRSSLARSRSGAMTGRWRCGSWR